MNVDRCSWCLKDPLYIEYHDKEWGVLTSDDRKLFEFLVLESAQAGLSWLTVLRKRENYRRLYDDFNFEKVALFSKKKIESLLKNPEIIRNRAKIEASVSNAQKFLDVLEEFGSFHRYSLQFTDGEQIQNKWRSLNQVPATTRASDAFAKDLKTRGFKFLGSTVMYAHMQATGLVNDHLVSCFRYKEVLRRR